MAIVTGAVAHAAAISRALRYWLELLPENRGLVDPDATVNLHPKVTRLSSRRALRGRPVGGGGVGRDDLDPVTMTKLRNPLQICVVVIPVHCRMKHVDAQFDRLFHRPVAGATVYGDEGIGRLGTGRKWY